MCLTICNGWARPPAFQSTCMVMVHGRCPGFLAPAVVKRPPVHRVQRAQCINMSSMRQTLVSAVSALCFLGVYSESSEPQMDLNSGKQCSARLDLPADYDRLKLPKNTTQGPIEVQMELDIRQVSEVDESKKSYTLELHFYMRWRDGRLAGQTGKTNCSPLFPDHTTPEFWIPGGTHFLYSKWVL